MEPEPGPLRHNEQHRSYSENDTDPNRQSRCELCAELVDARPPARRLPAPRGWMNDVYVCWGERCMLTWCSSLWSLRSLARSQLLML